MGPPTIICQRLIDLLQLLRRRLGKIHKQGGYTADLAPRRLFAIERFHAYVEPERTSLVDSVLQACHDVLFHPFFSVGVRLPRPFFSLDRSPSSTSCSPSDAWSAFHLSALFLSVRGDAETRPLRITQVLQAAQVASGALLR
jgi:hypothetical protein